MLVLETNAKTRCACFVQGTSIKAICRDLRVSWKSVRKVFRSEETAFTYERRSQPQPKIGPWREELDRLLAANAARPSRERPTLARIFEERRGLAYEGRYDTVRRYAAARRRGESAATAAAFVPLSVAPGAAYRFDRSQEVVVIDGVTTTVTVAHVRLCHGRTMFLRAYPVETQGRRIHRRCSTRRTRRSPSSAAPAQAGSMTASIDPPLIRGQWTRRRQWT